MKIKVVIAFMILFCSSYGHSQTATPTPIKLNLIPDIYASDPWRKWFMTFVELNDFPSDTSNLQAGTVSNVHGELWEWTGSAWIPIRSYEHGYGLSATYIDGITTFSLWTPTVTPTSTDTPTPTATPTPWDIDAGNSNIIIQDTTANIYVIGLATDTVYNVSGAIAKDETYAVSDRVREVTFTVAPVIQAASAVSGKAFVTLQREFSSSLVSATDAEDLLHVNPTPPIKVAFSFDSNQNKMEIWLDPTPTPTAASYEVYEEALPVGTKTFQTQYSILQIDRIEYEDQPTTNNAAGYHPQQLPIVLRDGRPGWVQIAANQFQVTLYPSTTNRISGGAVVTKCYIYYLTRFQ